MIMDFFLCAVGNSKNDQKMTGLIAWSDNSVGPTTGTGSLQAPSFVRPVAGTGNENSTLNQTLEVKFQHSFANSNIQFTRFYALLQEIGH